MVSLLQIPTPPRFLPRRWQVRRYYSNPDSFKGPLTGNLGTSGLIGPLSWWCWFMKQLLVGFDSKAGRHSLPNREPAQGTTDFQPHTHPARMFTKLPRVLSLPCSCRKCPIWSWWFQTQNYTACWIRNISLYQPLCGSHEQDIKTVVNRQFKIRQLDLWDKVPEHQPQNNIYSG